MTDELNRWHVCTDGVAHYMASEDSGRAYACGPVVMPIRPWLVTRDVGVVPLCPDCMARLREIVGAMRERLETALEDHT